MTWWHYIVYFSPMNVVGGWMHNKRGQFWIYISMYIESAPTLWINLWNFHDIWILWEQTKIYDLSNAREGPKRAPSHVGWPNEPLFQFHRHTCLLLTHSVQMEKYLLFLLSTAFIYFSRWSSTKDVERCTLMWMPEASFIVIA